MKKVIQNSRCHRYQIIDAAHEAVEELLGNSEDEHNGMEYLNQEVTVIIEVLGLDKKD